MTPAALPPAPVRVSRLPIDEPAMPVAVETAAGLPDPSTTFGPPTTFFSPPVGGHDAPDTPAPDDGATVASWPPDEAPPASSGPTPPARSPSTEELAAQLMDPLVRRLKTELRLDRERRGALTDLRH